MALGIVIGTSLTQKANAQRIVYQNGQWSIQQSKVDQLLQLMEKAYVDDLSIDSITDEAMTELVQKLDPHSAYIPKQDLEMVNSELAGSFSGIGVQLLSFPGEDPVSTRGQAFFGRAAECIEEALGEAGAGCCLVPSGLCVIPKEGLPVSMVLTGEDLTDAPSY